MRWMVFELRSRPLDSASCRKLCLGGLALPLARARGTSPSISIPQARDVFHACRFLLLYRLLVLMPAPTTRCLTNYWGCKPSVFSTRATNSSAPSGSGRYKVRAAVATRLMHPYRRVSQGLDLGLSRRISGRRPFGSAPATKCLAPPAGPGMRVRLPVITGSTN
jgi:hypothetical protein